jgi:hypothetical protein
VSIAPFATLVHVQPGDSSHGVEASDVAELASLDPLAASSALVVPFGPVVVAGAAVPHAQS